MAIDLVPDYSKAFYNMGIPLYEIGRFDEALDAFEWVYMLDPLRCMGLVLSGRLFSQNRNGTMRRLKLAEAIPCNRKPDHADIWVIKGIARYRPGKFADAVEALDQAIAQNPLVADAWLYKGFSLFELGWYEDAVYALDKAAEMNPSNTWLFFFRGKAFQNLICFREAVADFDRVVAAEPDNKDAVYRRGRSCVHRGRYDKGACGFNQILATEGESCWRLLLQGDCPVPSREAGGSDRGFHAHPFCRSRVCLGRIPDRPFLCKPRPLQ